MVPTTTSVIKSYKIGKVRKVLNGAARIHGTFLNKSLLPGPDQLMTLVHVLPRFRPHQFAVSTVFEGIFLQVGVVTAVSHHCVFFSWRQDQTTNVTVYQYTKHIFGAEDTPTCADYALQFTDRDKTRSVSRSNQRRPRKLLHGRLHQFGGFRS